MIIISLRPGQLGNSLFLFSHFIAYSLESDSRVIDLAFYEYADYFTLTSKEAFPQFPRRKLSWKISWLRKPVYHFFYFVARIVDRTRLNNSLVVCIHLQFNEKFFLHDERNKKKLNALFVFAQGWLFRCEPYLIKNKDFIRNYFHLVDKHQQNVDRVIASARKDCEVLVGLHIRHGDYAHFEGGKYFYSLDQYYSVMLKVSELFKDKKIRFLVSSNGQHDYSVFKNMDYCVPTGNEVEDMYALAKCDYLLGPPSTYTMWASFYGSVPLYKIIDIDHPVNKKDFLLWEEWM
jgi:hypothetical protein